jgi:hypothetical protein
MHFSISEFFLMLFEVIWEHSLLQKKGELVAGIFSWLHWVFSAWAILVFGLLPIHELCFLN